MSTSSVNLSFALFDSAFHTPGGSHWTWHAPALTPQVLDSFYEQAVAPALARAYTKGAAQILAGGFAGIDRQWCACFRLFDAGRDQRGRPGRYLMPVVFIDRRNARGIDIARILSHVLFRQFGQIAQSAMAPPLPCPQALVASEMVPARDVASRVVDQLRKSSGRSSIDQSQWSAAAAACTLLEEETRWTLTLEGDFRAPTAFISIANVAKDAPRRPEPLPRVPAPKAPSHDTLANALANEFSKIRSNPKLAARYLGPLILLIVAFSVANRALDHWGGEGTFEPKDVASKTSDQSVPSSEERPSSDSGEQRQRDPPETLQASLQDYLFQANQLRDAYSRWRGKDEVQRKIAAAVTCLKKMPAGGFTAAMVAYFGEKLRDQPAAHSPRVKADVD